MNSELNASILLPQFSVHLNMAQESMDIYANKKLDPVAHVEQNCATGLTSSGKTPKTLVEDMVPLLGDQVLTSVRVSRDAKGLWLTDPLEGEIKSGSSRSTYSIARVYRRRTRGDCSSMRD